MGKHFAIEIPLAEVDAHPAVAAWSRVAPEREKLQHIEVVSKHKKSQIYRLHGVGREGFQVIAKRCWRETALIERIVYERVLPHLPVTALRCYGFIEEENADFCWLFLEDAGDEEYSPLKEEHRALAARWLGTVHSSASLDSVATRFPDRGPDHYLLVLQSSRGMILDSFTNPALQAEDLMVLKNVVSQLDAMEKAWNQVARFCERMPRTLAHGDLVVKNVRVRRDDAGDSLLVMDWETVGWGVPAADLAQFAGRSLSPDVSVYWSVIHPYWPHLDLRDLQQLASIGKIFRAISAISWASMSLKPHWVDNFVRDMRCYEQRLAAILGGGPVWEMNQASGKAFND